MKLNDLIQVMPLRLRPHRIENKWMAVRVHQATHTAAYGPFFQRLERCLCPSWAMRPGEILLRGLSVRMMSTPENAACLLLEL